MEGAGSLARAVQRRVMARPGLRIKETKEVYEGEVTELTPEETENQNGEYGKVIQRVVIGLRTVKGSKQLRLDPSIYDSLQKEKVQARSPPPFPPPTWSALSSLSHAVASKEAQATVPPGKGASFSP